MRRNPETDVTHQGGSIVPARKPKKEANRQGGSIVPARQPEREASHQGGSMVPFMVSARQLEITHSENPQKWAWSFIYEKPE